MGRDRKIIAIARPYFDDREAGAVAEVLSSGWIVQGPKVSEFERLFEAFQECRYALATTSATTALHLALVSLDIGRDDEVILPAYTHPATANVVGYVGARPVFVDVRLPNFNVDPALVEKSLTGRTKAIIPVHLFGLPADMDPLLDLAKASNLKVIEDAACAHGAEYKGRKVGTIGHCGAFSFHPRKAVTTGEGGMLVTNDRELAARAGRLRSHGESMSDEWRHRADEVVYPDYVDAGFNYRMTDIQGAIGVEQMKKLPQILEEKRRLAARYTRLLSGLEKSEHVILPHEADGFLHTYQSYVILLRGRVQRERDRLSNELQKRGIATRKGTYHVPGTKYYRETFGFKKGDFPNSELADKRSLALPLYAGMTEEEMDYVVENLQDVVKGA